MMSLQTISSPGGAGGYYSKADNYYFIGELMTQWHGKLAEEMGLSGNVDIERFTELLEGKISEDKVMGKDHRPGVDMTFSAPKSVSVLSLVGKDERLLEAFKESVYETIPKIEQFISTRITKDKETTVVNTGKGIFASFIHDTSRNLDPQLHMHVINMNITEHEGEIKSLSSDFINKSGYMELIYKHHTLFGQWQRNILEEKAKDLGYEIEHKDNGLWEIKGVPEEITEHFSSRSRDIKESVGDNASFESRNVAALDTRTEKTAPDKEKLIEQWNVAINESGFDMNGFISKSNEISENKIDENNKGIITSPYIQKSISYEEQKELMNEVLSSLSNQKRDFSYNEVLLEIAKISPKSFDYSQAEKMIDDTLSDGGLIPLESDKTRFTSSIHLLDEQTVKILSKQHIQDGSVLGTKSFKIDKKAEFLSNENISIINVPSTKKGIHDIAEIVSESSLGRGRDTYLLTPTVSRKEQIFSLKDVPDQNKMIFSALRDTTTTFKQNSTLIIDNAERLSAKDAVGLLSYANESNLQLVLLNSSSRESHTNVLSLFKDGGAKEHVIIHDDNSTILNISSEKDKRARLKNVSNEYLESLGSAQKNIVLSTNKSDRTQLTDEIRAGLKERGYIKGEGEKVYVESRRDVYLTNKEKGRISSYTQGMVIEDRRTTKRESFSILSVNDEKKTLSLKNSSGDISVVKASELADKDVRVFNSQQLEVVVGERLKLTAADKSQGTRAKDELAVTSISGSEITALNMRNGENVIYSVNNPIYADYNYVHGIGEINNSNAKVIVALSNRDLNANNINSIRMSGNEISIHSPLDEKESIKKINNLKIKTTISDVVIKKSGEDNISLATDVLKENVQSNVSIAVNRAIEGLRSVGISQLDLTKEAVRFDKNAVGVSEEITSRIANGQLIPVGDKSNPILVPKATYETERDIIGIINAGKSKQQPLLIDVKESTFNGLTNGQKNAVKDILTTTDSFTIIQGYAGVGKTTKLKTLQGALSESLGETFEIKGLGPTHRSVGEMQDVGIDAQTLKSFIIGINRDSLDGIKHDFKNTLFIIDETSMVGNADLRDALGHISRAGGRAVTMGDKDQFLSIESGSPFHLVQERSSAKVTEMVDVVRQTNRELKQAVYRTIEGRHSDSLNLVSQLDNSLIPRVSGTEFINNGSLAVGDVDTIATDFLNRTQDARNETLIIAGTNNVRRSINENIQGGLIKEGAIDINNKVSFPVFTQQGFTRTDLNEKSKWNNVDTVLKNDVYYDVIDSNNKDFVTVKDNKTGKVEKWSYKGLESGQIEAFQRADTDFYEGDKVILRKTDVDSGKKTNEPYYINNISESGILTLEGKDGIRTLDPLNNDKDRHIDLGYAVTSTGAQGASSKYVIGYMGTDGAEKNLTNDRGYYIVISRAKEHVQIYTDDKEELSKLLQVKDNSALTAHDLILPKTNLEKSQLISSFSKDLDTYHAGKILISEFNISKDNSDLRLLSRTRNSPLRLSVDTYDENGKYSGIDTFELSYNKGTVVIGDKESLSDNAKFSVIQRGTNGVVLSAGSIQETLSLAKENPESSVILANSDQEITSQVYDVINMDRINSVNAGDLLDNSLSQEDKNNIEELVIDSVSNSEPVDLQYIYDAELAEPEVGQGDNTLTYNDLYSEYLSVSEPELVAVAEPLPQELEADLYSVNPSVADNEIIIPDSAPVIPVSVNPEADLPQLRSEQERENILTDDDLKPELYEAANEKASTDLAEIEMTLVDRTSNHSLDIDDYLRSDNEKGMITKELENDIFSRNRSIDKEI